jgi:3-oxoacyl-[acyl-carrier protein] reductase
MSFIHSINQSLQSYSIILLHNDYLIPPHMCILVGIFGGSPIASTTNEQFDQLFDVNVKGVFYALRAAANNIENNGRIVVIGSVLKSGTSAGYGPYSATKAAIEVLSNTLAQELGSKGVTVNAIHPGKLMSFPNHLNC